MLRWAQESGSVELVQGVKDRRKQLRAKERMRANSDWSTDKEFWRFASLQQLSGNPTAIGKKIMHEMGLSNFKSSVPEIVTQMTKFAIFQYNVSKINQVGTVVFPRANTVFYRSDDQINFHREMSLALLPQFFPFIGGGISQEDPDTRSRCPPPPTNEYKTFVKAVLRLIGWGHMDELPHVRTRVIIIAPRRFGKTVSLASIIAAYVLVSPGDVCNVYAQSKPTADSIRDLIRKFTSVFLEEVYGWNPEVAIPIANSAEFHVGCPPVTTLDVPPAAAAAATTTTTTTSAAVNQRGQTSTNNTKRQRVMEDLGMVPGDRKKRQRLQASSTKQHTQRDKTSERIRTAIRKASSDRTTSCVVKVHILNPLQQISLFVPWSSPSIFVNSIPIASTTN